MRLHQMRRNRRRSLPVAFAIACVVAFTRRRPAAAGRNIESHSRASKHNADSPAGGGLEIVENGGYPELHVDGKPFFIHSAAFFYYRIPVDQWEHLLRVYRSYGINTIDLYIPWNWHEPKEGEIDFDGHTNPRRNLRALLALIEQREFSAYCTARSGNWQRMETWRLSRLVARTARVQDGSDRLG